MIVDQTKKRTMKSSLSRKSLQEALKTPLKEIKNTHTDQESILVIKKGTDQVIITREGENKVLTEEAEADPITETIEIAARRDQISKTTEIEVLQDIHTSRKERKKNNTLLRLDIQVKKD